MDTEELTKLCDSLSLTEAEEDIFVLQGDSKVRAEKFTACCLLDSKIWFVEDIDSDPNGSCFGKFLRVRISIDITKPLRRGIKIKLQVEEECTVLPLLYERLPDFCFYCGCIGHVFRECTSSSPHVMSMTVKDKQFEYGPWLRASTFAEKLKHLKSRDKEGKKIEKFGTAQNEKQSNPGSAKIVEPESEPELGESSDPIAPEAQIFSDNNDNTFKIRGQEVLSNAETAFNTDTKRAANPNSQLSAEVVMVDNASSNHSSEPATAPMQYPPSLKVPEGDHSAPALLLNNFTRNFPKMGQMTLSLSQAQIKGAARKWKRRARQSLDKPTTPDGNVHGPKRISDDLDLDTPGTKKPKNTVQIASDDLEGNANALVPLLRPITPSNLSLNQQQANANVETVEAGLQPRRES
ncbi:Zinc knuckle CX2CX4HX4C [Melia azedarach]|uniref:Zinc knuckle CX2CX4HX4C n=1 Tax=Melia azedarach TaxID=155640 RepID=A0ACC1YJV2_MELAZ|nr:Zinc knuckle CX2CX4HX4C [Melia azedarach]